MNCHSGKLSKINLNLKNVLIILITISLLIILNRFLDLPAQAIRCSLDGVFRPRNTDGSQGLVYSEETFEFMRRFCRKPAVAFFSKWLAGQVGRTTEKISFELMVLATL